MSNVGKDAFAELLQKYESVGILPKGKAADMIENYDTLTAEPVSEERATVPDDIDHDALDEQTKKRARKV